MSSFHMLVTIKYFGVNLLVMEFSLLNLVFLMMHLRNVWKVSYEKQGTSRIKMPLPQVQDVSYPI